MIKHLLIICFFTFGTCLSQDLEETIYVATETFNVNRNATSFSELLKSESQFKNKITTKDEYLAYLFLLLNKANYLDTTNKQPEAVLEYETAWSIYQEKKLQTITDYDIIEFCLKPLGILYNKTGDYTNAENTIKQYIFLAEKQHNNAHRISGAINLAQLYFSAGKYNDALTISSVGLKIKELTKEQELKLSQINTNSQIALKSITNDSDIPTNLVADTYNKTLETKYNIAINNEDFENALVYLNQLITKMYSTENMSARILATYYLQKAQIHYNLSQNDTSLIELNTALKILLPNINYDELPKKEDLYAENTFIDIFDLLAVLQTNTQNALACYDKSFYVSQLLTNNLTSQEAKLVHLSNNRKRSEACISLLFDSFKVSNDKRFIHQAFVYAEKHKAAILKEAIDKKSLLELHPNDSLLIKEQQLLQQQERLTNELIREQNLQNSTKTNQLNKKLNNTSIALKQLKLDITKVYPETEKSTISIDSIQERLLEDEAILVAYFYGDTAVFQFNISPTNTDFIKIERDKSFNAIISNYISYFNNATAINNNISQFTNDAFKVYNLLEFEKTNTHKNVVIIPDGFLNFIPFESLLTQQTTSTSYSKMPFVINNQRLAYNTSATLYLHNKPFEYSNSVLGVFPVFENSSSTLTYSLNEAESIEKEVNAKFLMYQAATKEAVLRHANDYGILHLSTHANSGDFSVPANIELIDSTLYLNELYSLNLNNKLVILSACETGVGKLQKGEGSMNLARGFRYAGVENLLFSVWKINDLSTSQIMAKFYKDYKKTKSAFIANNTSKLAYLNDEEISNIKKSPYYWSAFIYHGDLTKDASSKVSKYLLIIFSSLGIGLLLWFLIFKPKNGQET